MKSDGMNDVRYEKQEKEKNSKKIKVAYNLENYVFSSMNYGSWDPSK